MSGAHLVVRTATEADEPAIARLLDRTFQPRPFDRRRALWRWRSQDNPARQDSMPGFLVVCRDDTIVAVHGLLPLRISVDGEVFAASVSCDLAVHEGARSVGLRLKLAVLDPAIAPLHISTSANRPANAITHALGGHDIPGAQHRYIKVLRIDGIARQRLTQRFGRTLAGMAAVAAVPANLALSARRAARRSRMPAGTRIEPVTRFDDRFDAMHSLLSRRFRVMVVRDAAYLNWRYGRYPFGGIQAFALWREETPIGLGVLHTGTDEDGLTFGSILELVTEPPIHGACAALLHTLIASADANRAHYLTAWCTAPELEAALRHRGFIRRSLDYSPATWRAAAEPPPEAFTDPAGWYLSLGDGDASFLYP